VLIALFAAGLLIPSAWPKMGLAPRFLGFGMVLWGLVAGLGGLMLLLYWTATTHYDTHYNENLLVTPFTHLWLLGPGFKLLTKGALGQRTRKIATGYLIGSLGLIALDLILKLGPFIQGNYGVIALATVCNGLLLAGFARRR